ncbi:SubName: Full=Related to B2-aldehyde-forming enzyme {ECO:0000313/EMBL:CCA67114.1} [Serendipita indica DSM 11827]|nr:SubName: Full=Related to B2-aldehyde-forming enzyme {ECO:0000313/EMBL:CCA67114.1} [Serendipita indica DSM 11827]
MFRLLLAALVAPLLVLASPVSLSKRTSGRATYYQVGLGACGQYNQPGDFIVALNAAQFEVGGGYPSPQCFRRINIHYGGKTASAVVMDECPYGACNYGDLDLSEGLFTFFAPTSAGVFYMEWEFEGEGGAPPPPPPPPPPPQEPTSVYTPPPEVHTPPPSSETPVHTPTPSSSSTEAAVTAESVNTDTPQNNAPATGDALAGLGIAAGRLVNMLNIAHAG